MTKVIQNKIISVYGLPWQGKTFFATYLASQYRLIYSNVKMSKGVTSYQSDIVSHYVDVSNDIRTIQDIERISYSDTKGVVVLDESGLNINSRQSSSSENMQYARLWMLGRKKNVDIIIIAQLERSVDVYFRELSTWSVDMRSYFERWEIKFEATAKNRFWTVISVQNVDLVKWAEKEHYIYDSLESSEIKKGEKEKKETLEISF